MEIKKIALLNIQRCDSHGAVLLAYALEQILNQKGYQVQTLDYKYAGRIVEKNIVKNYVLRIKIKIKKQLHLSYIGKKIKGKSVKNEFDIQSQRFRLFRQKRLHLTREITDVHDDLLSGFDAFIVGSDVVWKPEIAACVDRELFFLKSVPVSSKRIAYAASIGTDDEDILESCSSAYVGAFDSIDCISIREQSMIPFVEKYTNKLVKSVIDPVFLLNSEDYLKVENNTQKVLKNKQYIYVYLLGKNKNALNEANKLAESLNMSILLDLNDGFNDANIITVPFESAISAGPAEFLYNIRNASYVITDSFHATAFSILFNISFWVFKRGTISVRMSDLLERFSLTHRMYEGILNQDKISWEHVNITIEEERKRGLAYLFDSLKGEK